MAGQFEIFTDAESNVRFRLLGADGTVLAVSKAFEDKRSAADGIMAVRECAGTGLIRETHSTPWGGTTWTTSSKTPHPHPSRRRHSPAV
ncbi:YegP family protein [Arthrobacter sp. Hor0625]|uniref:YegP family protein n=1 Tax=Arthrobacter sp. Hor0625 TaxID=3457358 RepID=UPI00403EDEEF